MTLRTGTRDSEIQDDEDGMGSLGLGTKSAMTLTKKVINDVRNSFYLDMKLCKCFIRLKLY